WSAMKMLKTFVQGLCDTVDPTNAVAMITTSGLLVGESTKAPKPLFKATWIPAMGIVHLAVNARMLLGGRTSKKTTFTWSWSSDRGQPWSAGGTTGYTYTDVLNLGPGSYRFKVFATVGDVPEEPVTTELVIH